MPVTVNSDVYRIATAEESKKAQLDTLLAVDKFCKENNIRYFLYYGSLLGAIRHKGFIPWDDDIDIAMLREDYDKFIDTFSDPDTDLFAQGKTENYPFYLTKICKKDTAIIEDMGKDGYIYGAGLDLFPLDSIPDNAKVSRKMLRKVKLCMAIRNVKTVPFYKKRKVLRAFAIKTLYYLLSGFSASKLMAKVNKTVKNYSKFESSTVADIMLPYGERSIVKKEWFADTVLTDFEGYKLPIPADYDKILTQIYRDYMTPPPQDKQIPRHDITVYIKREVKL